MNQIGELATPVGVFFGCFVDDRSYSFCHTEKSFFGRAILYVRGCCVLVCPACETTAWTLDRLEYCSTYCLFRANFLIFDTFFGSKLIPDTLLMVIYCVHWCSVALLYTLECLIFSRCII